MGTETKTYLTIEKELQFVTQRRRPAFTKRTIIIMTGSLHLQCLSAKDLRNPQSQECTQRTTVTFLLTHWVWCVSWATLQAPEEHRWGMEVSSSPLRSPQGLPVFSRDRITRLPKAQPDERPRRGEELIQNKAAWRETAAKCWARSSKKTAMEHRIGTFGKIWKWTLY